MYEYLSIYSCIIMTLLQHIINIIILRFVVHILFSFSDTVAPNPAEMPQPGPSTWLSFAVPLRHCVMQPIQLVIWDSKGEIREKCVGKKLNMDTGVMICYWNSEKDSLLPPLWAFFFFSFRVVRETENQTTPPTYHGITKSNMKHTSSWFPTNALKLTSWHLKQGVCKYDLSFFCMASFCLATRSSNPRCVKV